MPRVFVIQENPHHDISPAMEFGEVLSVLPPGDNNFSPDWTWEKLQSGLSNFTAQDFLLLTGDPTAIAMAALVATTHLLPEERLQVLKWNKQTRRYIPIPIQHPGE